MLMLRIFIIVLFFLWSSIWILPSYAHPGGGPPFLKINGKFANTDSYSPKAEDITPELFLVNQEIEFTLDTNILGVPEDIVEQSEFRWKFDDVKEYKYGQTIKHAFKTPKSHEIILDVKGPGDQGHTTLNIIRLNIVKQKSYKIPKVLIKFRTDQNKGTSPIQFDSTTELDLSSSKASYVWEFGDGDTASTEDAQHIYKGDNYSYLASLKVTDANGYIIYTGAIINSINKTLDIVDPFLQGKKLVIYNTLEPNFGNSKSVSPDNKVGIMLAVLFAAFLALVWFVYNHKKRKNTI